MNTETQQAIRAEVMAEIERRPKWQFELVGVDYRGSFDEEQVAMLARGDWEGLEESIWEWESDAQHENAWALLEDIVGDLDDWDESIRQDWLHTEAGSDAIMAIMERDESTVLRDLARQSGNVLLRVRASEAEDVLDEEEGEVHYWIAAVNVIDLYDLPYDCERVRLTHAYPWRGDVWNGGGMVDDDNPETVEVARADLRTDKDANGYSWTEVACPIISYYESKIEVVE